MYRNLSLLQAEFNEYMMHAERAVINQEAVLWYESSPATKKAGKESQKKGKKEALSRLSFALFVDSKQQEKYQEEYAQLFELAKRLFHVLYKEQQFYQEMKQKVACLADPKMPCSRRSAKLQDSLVEFEGPG